MTGEMSEDFDLEDEQQGRFVTALFTKDGRAFELYDTAGESEAPMAFLYPLNEQRRVGYVWTRLSAAGDLELEEVFLEARPEDTSSNLGDDPQGALGQRTSVELRGQGLGTALLDYVIERARQLGARSIFGRLHPSGRLETPFLLDWLKRHGFWTEELPDGVADVLLDLRATPPEPEVG